MTPFLSLIFVVPTRAAPAVDASAPTICSQLKDVYFQDVAAARGDLSELVRRAQAAAGRQADPRCAAALLNLAAIDALRLRANRVSGAPSADDDLRLLVGTAWGTHQDPTGAAVRAVACEEVLPATPPDEDVERCAAAWVDALWAAGSSDGWSDAPSNVRRLALRGARRFALHHMAATTPPDPVTWSTLRALTRLAIDLDRPVDDVRWTGIFPSAPNEMDKKDRNERAEWRSWSSALPYVPSPDGQALARGLFWRTTMYEVLLAQSLGPAALTAPYDAFHEDQVADVLLYVSPPFDAWQVHREVRALVAAAVTPSWSDARRSALAAMEAHMIVRELPDPEVPENQEAFWTQTSEALSLLVAAVGASPKTSQDGGPIDIAFVGDEVMLALIDGLAMNEKDSGARSEEVADAVTAVSAPLPRARRVLLLMAQSATEGPDGSPVYGAVPSIARRMELARLARDLAWQAASATPAQDGAFTAWLSATADYLFAAWLLDDLSAHRAEGDRTAYRPDPKAFERVFLSSISTNDVLTSPPDDLGPDGCQALDEIVGTADLEARVAWAELGRQRDLPGEAGRVVSEALRRMAASIKKHPEVCDEAEADGPTEPARRDPHGMPSDASWNAVSRWFTIASDVGPPATSSSSPARLGSLMAIQRASDALLDDDLLHLDQKGADAAGKTLCAAVTAWSAVGGSLGATYRERVTSYLTQAREAPGSNVTELDEALSACSAVPPSGTGAFARLPVRVWMSSPPPAEGYAVAIAGMEDADVLSAWLTRYLRARLPQAADQIWKDRPLVPDTKIGAVTLIVGAQRCGVTSAEVRRGIAVYNPPDRCVTGLRGESMEGSDE